MQIKEILSKIYHSCIASVYFFPFPIVRALFSNLFFQKVGRKVLFARHLDVRSPYRISIGNYTSINKKVLLDGRGGFLKIGHNVELAKEKIVWDINWEENELFDG